MEQRQFLHSLDTPCPTLSENDMSQAEELLDMLLEGDVAEPEQQPATDILQAAMMSENLHDDSGFVEDPLVAAPETSGFVQEPLVAAQETTYGVSNVTQFQTADGNKVIIVIQPAAPAAPEVVASDDIVVDDSDSDWTPDLEFPSTKKKPGRKREARSKVAVTADGKVTKRSYTAVRDRKQRKKLQNVEAARRYRDKKKQESEMEDEEKELRAKNTELKEKLTDIENEFETMKKLMVDLGLLKVVKKSLKK